MGISIDKAFGIHEHALKLRSARGELLAANLANADTPGFQSRDFDFQSALAQAEGRAQAGVMRATNTRHLSTSGNSPVGVDLLYRVPIEPSIDGNTVDVNLEKSRFAENSVRYQSSLEFLSSDIRGLLRAIRGE